MVINCAMVVGTLVFALARPHALPGTEYGHGGAHHHPGRPVSLQTPTSDDLGRRGMRVAATVDSFSPPPPRAKKRHPPARRHAPAAGPASSGAAPADEVEEEAPPPPRAPPRKRAVPPAEAEPEEGAAGDEEEEDKPRPAARRSEARHRDADEEGASDEDEAEEDSDAPFTSLPPVLPRLITFGVGGSALGRSFAFNTPLQKENAFPRMGVAASLETYPLIRLSRGWYRTLGIAAQLAIEFGTAALLDQGTGLTASYPVSQRRYSFDARYTIPLGERLVIIPALGLGNNTFDLKNRMPVAPSQCNATPPTVGGITAPCLADVQATYLIADLHVRVAVSDTLALSLSGGYFLGMAVGRGLGQIGQERTPKMSGYHATLGATLLLSDWFAVRGEIPFLSYGYTFTEGTATYTSASETYYGATVSAVLFTR